MIQLVTNLLVILSIICTTQQQEPNCTIDFATTICRNINFDNAETNLIKTVEIRTARLIIEQSIANELNHDNFKLQSISDDHNQSITIDELVLRSNNFTKIAPQLLCSTFTDLQYLEIVENRFPQLTKELFENCHVLKQLYLANVTINDDEVFIGLKNLEILYIENGRFQVDPLPLIFKNTKNLKSLTLHFTNIRNYLNNSNLFDKLLNLESLNLQHNELTTIHLDNFEKLQILDLSYNNFDNTVWQLFNGDNCKSLKVLFLDHNQINDIPNLEKLLDNCQQLERVFLSGRRFLSEKIQQIDKELKMIVAESGRKFNIIWVDN